AARGRSTKPGAWSAGLDRRTGSSALFTMAKPSLRQRQGYAKSKAMPINPSDPPLPVPPVPKPGGGADAKPSLPDAAVRALAEAAARRRERGCDSGAQPAKEVDGRDGLDPTHYGDWEVNGLASDF